ncbi:fibronectin type III domain-containing protein [Elongatibacter sediminis]|uniref:Fibronectin type III domain-containing protein n=1 Tax=Elongatibacter sediminis TaxID=3119006 RepID=A0AAW9R4W0_9GAMM
MIKVQNSSTIHFLVTIGLLVSATKTAAQDPCNVSMSSIPTTIELGDSVNFSVFAENCGASTSNDAGINISFPQLNQSGDLSRVSYNSSNLPSEAKCDAGSTLCLFLRPGTGGQLPTTLYVAYERYTSSWGAGSSRNINLSVTPRSLGTFTIQYRAYMNSPSGYLGEPTNGSQDQQNWWVMQKSLTVVQPKPDLIATIDAKLEPWEWGESVGFDLEVSNIGSGTAGSSTAHLVLSNDNTIGDGDDILIDSFSVAAGSWALSYPHTLPTSAPAGFPENGDVYFGLIADATDTVDEENEGNNTDSDRVTMSTPVEDPDLTAFLQTVGSEWNWGENVGFSVEIFNGGGPAGASTARLVMSNDSTIGDADDYFLHSFNVPAGTLAISHPELLPATPPAGFPENGTVWFGLIADFNDNLVESNEGNNTNFDVVTMSARIVENGTTVITHGYQLTGSFPGWVEDMADAIVARAGAGSIWMYIKNSNEFVLQSEFGGGGGETVLLFDWADESNNDWWGFSEAAGDSLFTALISGAADGDFSLDNLHFIGHSRGVVVNSEAAERLLHYEFVTQIDQFTALDPHWDGVGAIAEDDDVNQYTYPSRPVVGWLGTDFVDNYHSEDNECGNLDGAPFDGAYNFDLSGREVGHSAVHEWYRATIDLDWSISVPLCNPDTSLWYDQPEPGCFAEARSRNVSGYYHSRIGSGHTEFCPQTEKLEVKFNPEFEGILNGDFDRGPWGAYTIVYGVPGWGANGGGGDGDIENGALKLSDNETYLAHNPLFVPETAQWIQYRARVSHEDLDDTFEARINGVSMPCENLSLASETAEWKYCLIDATGYQGQIIQLGFYLIEGGDSLDAVVWVDDVQFFLDPTESGTPPDAPTNLEAVALSASSIEVNWQDNSIDEHSFKIERRMGAGPWAEIQVTGPTVESFTDTGLASSTAYEYRARASNEIGDSPYSNTDSATTQAPPPMPPSAPDGLIAFAASNTQIGLFWSDNSEDEEGFKIERKAAGGAWSEVGVNSANDNTFTDSGLPDSSTFDYRVRAWNGIGNSAYTNEDSATTDGLPLSAPNAPSSLNAIAVSSNRINVTWIDNSNNEVYFKLERRVGGSNWLLIATLPADEYSYADEGLTSSTTYEYRLRAWNSEGYSDHSNVDSATTLAPPPSPPNAPSTLNASAASANEILLDWVDNSDNEDLFKIERQSGGNGWSQLITVPANETTYFDVGLSSSTTYEYRIRAWNPAGHSGYSNEASDTTADSPSTPKIPRGIDASFDVYADKIQITWDDVSGEDYYEVYRCTDTSLGSCGAPISSSAGNVTTHDDFGAEIDVTYYYRVKACLSDTTCSDLSEYDAGRRNSVCLPLTLEHTGLGSDPVATPSGSTGCAPSGYHAGELINLTATPNSGWGVGSWNGTNNDGSTSTINQITMPTSAHTVSVHYVQHGTGEVLFSDGFEFFDSTPAATVQWFTTAEVLDDSIGDYTLTQNNALNTVYPVLVDGLHVARFDGSGTDNGSVNKSTPPNGDNPYLYRSGTLLGGDDGTVAFWMKVTEDRSTGYGLFYERSTSWGHLQVARWSGDLMTVKYGIDDVNTAQATVTGVDSWTHIAAVHVDDSLRFYVNGELVASGSAGSPGSAFATVIGCTRNGSTYFVGDMHDYRVWVGTVLTAQQIEDVYNEKASILQNQ